MTRTKSTYLALIAFLLSPMAANAVPIVVGGQLTGATNVDVNGTLYDVSFVDGTCVELFDGCDEVSDFTFQTKDDATAAAQALFDQVLLDNGFLFDTAPEVTNGCGPVTCFIFTPYVVPNTAVLSITARNRDIEQFDATSQIVVLTTRDMTSDDFQVWAIWAPAQINAVPEPGTLALLGIGLLGLGLSRRRKKA